MNMSEKSFQYAKKIPILAETDILVIGGSQSGVAAAVSARRTNPNAKVLLIEQAGYLGGQSVGTMVIHYEFREYVNNAGQRIVKGIGHEMLERIIKKGHCDPLFEDYLEGKQPPFTNLPDNRAFGDIPLNLEDIKFTFQEMCDEAGVEIRYFTKLVDVIGRKDPGKFIKPVSAVVAYQGGLSIINAQIMIDCTAFNDVAWFLGKEEYVTIPKNIVMAMQTYAWIGGVDLEKFIDDVFAHPERWPLCYPNNKEQMILHMKQGKTIMMRGNAEYIDIAEEKWPGISEAYEKTGATPLIYYWLKTIKTHKIECNGKIKYIGDFAIEGPSYRKDQTNPDIVNDAMINQLKATHLLVKVHSVLPGWENCYLLRTSERMGFRQTRVLKGIYKLTRNDVKEHRKFEDVIGRASGHDVGRGNAESEYGYDIPYRILVPEKIDGLLVGARSVSCDTDDETLTALNAHRGISACIIVSQACGTAAALCLKEKVEPRKLNIKLLQSELKKQDVILEGPSEGPKSFYHH